MPAERKAPPPREAKPRAPRSPLGPGGKPKRPVLCDEARGGARACVETVGLGAGGEARRATGARARGALGARGALCAVCTVTVCVCLCVRAVYLTYTPYRDQRVYIYTRRITRDKNHFRQKSNNKLLLPKSISPRTSAVRAEREFKKVSPRRTHNIPKILTNRQKKTMLPSTIHRRPHRAPRVQETVHGRSIVYR